jgi:hypothetical protein
MDLYVWFLVKFYIAPDPLSRAKLSFFNFFKWRKQRPRSPRAEENSLGLKSDEVKHFDEE